MKMMHRPCSSDSPRTFRGCWSTMVQFGQKLVQLSGSCPKKVVGCVQNVPNTRCVPNFFCPYLNRQDFEPPPCHLSQNDHWIFTEFEKTFYGNCPVHGSSAAVLALIFPGSSDWQQHDTSSFIWRLNANVSDIQYQSCCWANDGAAKRSDEQREIVKWIFLGNIPNLGGKKDLRRSIKHVYQFAWMEWFDVFSDRSFFFWSGLRMHASMQARLPLSICSTQFTCIWVSLETFQFTSSNWISLKCHGSHMVKCFFRAHQPII